MKMPCPSIVICPGSAGPTGVDFPISNYSSEEPDAPIFIGFSSGWGHNRTALGTPFNNPGGFVFCLDTESVESADRCARNNVIDQTTGNTINNNVGGDGGTIGDGGGGTLNGGGGQQIYSSDQEQCAYTCPDGTLFVWTVSAGYVRASSIAQADSISQSLACRLATFHKICLSTIDHPTACADSDFFATIKASTGTLAKLPLTWEVKAGSLPPGLDLDTDTGGDPQASLTVGIIGHISAGASGAYQFTLRATDADGNFMQKSYTINVLVITQCPPDATPGIPYSYQMQTTGGTGPFTWQVTDGTLPPGLTMTLQGLISGTTTTVQAKYQFTMNVVDTGTNTACAKKCTMYNQCPGSNILDATFTAIKNSAGACGCPQCAGNLNTMTYGKAICAGFPENCDFSYQSSTFTSASNFTLRITISIPGNNVSSFAQHTMPLYKSGVFQTDLETSLSYSAGTHTFDFALSAGSYTIGKGGVNNARYSMNFGGDGTGSVTWTFENKC